MKTEWLKAIVPGVCIVLAMGWGAAVASDVKEGNAVSAPEQSMSSEEQMLEEPFGPGPEHVEQMLARIREKDPKKADELAQLREKDPEAFRAELRKVFREHFMGQMKQRRAEPGNWQPKGPQGRMQGRQESDAEPCSGFPGDWPKMMREQMREKNDEYIKWLKETYPDEATKLEQMKGEKPEQYMRAMGISWKKYGRIYMVSKDNPELAAVLKEQMTLKEQRMELLRQIRTAADDKKKKELTGELEQVVNKQFDLIVKRKELAYEDLAKRLSQLQKEVDQRKAEVEKWKNKDFKTEHVKQRVTEILSETEKFEWE